MEKIILKYYLNCIILTIYILPPTLFFHKRGDQIINCLFHFIINRFHAILDTKVPNIHTEYSTQY